MKAATAVACVLLGALPLAARADTQCLNTVSPAHSTLPKTVTACPAGDGFYTVRTMSTPCPPSVIPTAMAGVVVVLDFSCTPFEHCAVPGSYPVFDDAASTVTGVTNAQPYVTFNLQMGGGTPDTCVEVYAFTSLVRYAHLVSPDQNGDRKVNAADMAIVESKYGTTDLSADFDGNGLVEPRDRDFAVQHMGHQCATAGVPGPGRAAGIVLFVALGLLGLGALARPAAARGARAGRPGRTFSA